MELVDTGKNKIAIVHDSFLHFGGAERVLYSLIEAFPKADIYTSLLKEDFKKELIKRSNGKIYFSKLSKLPFIDKFGDYLKPYFFHFFWEKLNLNKYDLVISSSHSFCAHWINTKQNHISYILTTPRFLHNEINQMLWLKRSLFRIITNPYFDYLRKKNLKKMKKINYLLADSINVKNRIKKYYGLNAEVVYPPINNNQATTIKKNVQKTNNYLFFSRLVEQKGIELVIKTFNKNKKPLIVVGTSHKEKKWKSMANENIKFLGFVSDKKLIKIFQQSKALIYASIDEDFGIVPVEAMSHGLPVIAYESGGTKETIINKKTGLFFKEHSQKCLNLTIIKFEKMTLNKTDCIKQALKFDQEKFKKQIIKKAKNFIYE